MNRIDRLTAILIQLQSKKVVTAQEIAERFEISLRTVYRDVRSLEEAGVPLGAEAGKGYFIMDGYHLPPVIFTQEEANALVIGSKLIEGQTDKSIKKHFREAMFKIKSVLKSEEKEGLEKLESQIRVASIPQLENENFPNNFLSTIQRALVNQQVLEFKYFSNYTGDFNVRSVEPMGLAFYGGHWHLLAYCRLRKAPRDFRVDRLVKLQLLDETFETDPVRVAEFMKEVVRGNELLEVEVRIDKEVARFISTQKFYQGFVSETDKGNSIEMKFLVPSKEYFARWLVSFGSAVEIVSPESLRPIIIQLIEELDTHYRK